MIWLLPFSYVAKFECLSEARFNISGETLFEEAADVVAVVTVAIAD